MPPKRQAKPRRSLSAGEKRRKEQILTQSQPSKVSQSAAAVVCKDGSLFMTSDRSGDIALGAPHGLGLYREDCRYLDGYELKIAGRFPTQLSTFSALGYEAVFYLTNPHLPRGKGRSPLPKDAVAIKRRRIIRDSCMYELITLTNHSQLDVRFPLSIEFRSRFDDLFVVKGFVPDHGKVLPPERPDRDTVVLRYDALDGTRRTTTFGFWPRPRRLTGSCAEYDVRLAAGASSDVAITLTPRVHEGRPSKKDERATEPEFSPDDIERVIESDERDWLAEFASVTSSDPFFDHVMRRALLDLRLLRSERHGEGFVDAGIPWFATLFGRDACIVGLQTLPFGPRLAAETLRLLARYQAAEADAYRDAEPGKILHELRTGELARAGRIPQSPAYYGTVDATLLWIILLGQYVNWTGDLELARDLRPNLDAAIEWSVRHADHDGDGFLDYTGSYGRGLVNQGWKDSGNAIVEADGSLAEPPIALCEVQAYAYRAWRAAARVLRDLGDDERCEELVRLADDMRRRFEDRFWSDRLGCYVMALEKGGRSCEVASSNTGQVLWGGIASPERARKVAERILRPDMFTGWGVRTLSSEARAYNPVSYHLGSVWPHDNAMIVGGLRRYGHDDGAERILEALFDAASNFNDYRMPELYCGYARVEAQRSPVVYPVASSPQAWAAGSVPYALWQILGLRARAREERLELSRPRLPAFLDWLEIHGLGVAGEPLEVRFSRREDGSADVEALRGGKRVSVEVRG